MKRFLFAVAFCTFLTGVLSFFLFPVTRAAENPLLTLLNLPAPPPPNPQVSFQATDRPLTFFSKSNPPGDDSPIEDLIDYWNAQSSSYRELGYNPKPSGKALERLLAEVQKDPAKVFQFLNAFRGSKKAAELVKEIYDRSSSGNEEERNARTELRRWLTYNSPHFSTDLARDAAKVADVNEYVNHQEEFLALGRVDWERARPIVDRLYGGSQKVSRVLAQWALYRNALDNDSIGDIERYRDELKEVVEDKTATDGMRDLAFDALVKEKEWSGRDEWYYSLLADETLDDLRVGGRTYTGLTTIMYYSADEQYVDKMVELVKSDNKAVRTAAAKNLLHRLNTNNTEVIRALLPWLENPKWLNQDGSGRNQIVSALQHIKIPESVPVLIALLDEKSHSETTGSAYSNANAAVANAMRAVDDAANQVANAAGAANVANIASNSYRPRTEAYYPFRYSAIGALAFQEDARAIPALRRLLNEAAQPYEQLSLIGAVFKCGGFTVSEQVDALEYVARNAASFTPSSNTIANHVGVLDYPIGVGNFAFNAVSGEQPTDLRKVLGLHLAGLSEVVSDDLARAAVDRINALDGSDAQTASTMRKIVLRWSGPAVNTLLLRDLRNNKVEPDAILKLLSIRKDLREKQQSDVFDLRTGGPTAVGISACLLEDKNDFDAILDGSSDEAKTAMLACGRLIRAPFPVPKVAESLQSKDKLLALAAERYLESEDSPEARRIVLSLHPNEAKILGATTAFYTTMGEGAMTNYFLNALFGTISPYHALSQSRDMGYFQYEAIGETEKRLQEEVKQSPDLLGVYSWEENFIRIYKDRGVLSWEQDPARYRERVLTKEEFDNFKGLLAHHKADEMPPFLSCLGGEGCRSKELLMLGRNGGRRVFVKAASMPPLFSDVDQMFQEMRRPPSAIKYWASKEVPGLQLLFASDRVAATAVWKRGSDFRLLIADKVRRAEIDGEIETFAENLPANEEEPENESEVDERVSKEKLKREYENFSWNNFAEGTIGSVTTQPTQVEFIPPRDSFAVPPSSERWKARAGGHEIRADEKGLYKIVAGKLTKLKNGYYDKPVITPNGRWVVATAHDDDIGAQLVRINLITNKQFVVQPQEYPVYRAVAFISSINRVLVGPFENETRHDEDGQSEQANEDGRGYSLLDPETGSLTPARGEIRPLLQQTFRALQPTVKPFEFWAAIPKENETVIGLYNTQNFNLKPILKLPKIAFDSMDIWVDESVGMVYFVYEGHLLGAPITKSP